jgi:hypothetical protein
VYRQLQDPGGDEPQHVERLAVQPLNVLDPQQQGPVECQLPGKTYQRAAEFERTHHPVGVRVGRHDLHQSLSVGRGKTGQIRPADGCQ